jgi:hypothetical protein
MDQAGIDVEAVENLGEMPTAIKFAELIVQDCTRIIANQAWESRTSGANGDWTEFNSLSRVAGQIKQHFGVKE